MEALSVHLSNHPHYETKIEIENDSKQFYVRCKFWINPERWRPAGPQFSTEFSNYDIYHDHHVHESLSNMTGAKLVTRWEV